jgi:hypothetical protein
MAALNNAGTGYDGLRCSALGPPVDAKDDRRKLSRLAGVSVPPSVTSPSADTGRADAAYALAMALTAAVTDERRLSGTATGRGAGASALSSS